MPPDPEAFTVKEILTEIIIPRLDEISSSATSHVERTNDRLDKLEAWRDKFAGGLALVIALLIPVSIPVVIAVMSGKHI